MTLTSMTKVMSRDGPAASQHSAEEQRVHMLVSSLYRLGPRSRRMVMSAMWSSRTRHQTKRRRVGCQMVEQSQVGLAHGLRRAMRSDSRHSDKIGCQKR